MKNAKPGISGSYIPLLKLRIALEVSACTGKAQRVTLWDAVHLSQKDRATQPELHIAITKWPIQTALDRVEHDALPPTTSTQTSTSQNKSAKMSNSEIGRLIIDSIVALEHTGIDHEGNLQACWPFIEVRRTRCIERSTAKESNNWLRVIEDTQGVATFAVVCQRCLEFRQQFLTRSLFHSTP